MKKALICLICLLFFCNVGLLISQETTDLDDYNGKFWSGLEALEKVNFLQGFLTGIKAVYYETKYFKEAHEDPDYAETPDKEKAEVMEEVLNNIKATFNVFGMAYGKLVDGLDKVYKDSENRVIPIYRVLSPIAENIRGELDNDLLQDYLADLRDEYSK